MERRATLQKRPTKDREDVHDEAMLEMLEDEEASEADYFESLSDTDAGVVRWEIIGS